MRKDARIGKPKAFRRIVRESRGCLGSAGLFFWPAVLPRIRVNADGPQNGWRYPFCFGNRGL